MRFSYMSLFAMIIFSCNNPTNNPSKNLSNDEKRINDWSERIIKSRDSVIKDSLKYFKEVESWRVKFKDSKDEDLLSNIDFIFAKLLFWIEQDSLASIYFEKSIKQFENNQEVQFNKLIDAYTQLYSKEVKKGYVNAGIVQLSKAVYYAEKYNVSDSLKIVLFSVYGSENRVLLNNSEALKYLNKAIAIAEKNGFKKNNIMCLAEKATVHKQMNNEKEAENSLKEAENLANKYQMGQSFVFNHFAHYYGLQKQFSKSLEYLKKQEKIAVNDTVSYHINFAGAYIGLNDFKGAKSHILYLDKNFNKFSDQLKKLSLNQLVTYNLKTKNFQKADFYFNQSDSIISKIYTSEKALYSEDLIKKFELKQKEDEIELLNNRNKLLDKELTNKTLFFILILLLIFVALTVVVVLYLKQKNKKLALESKLVQIEDKLLRSQMDPHFVFNAMSSLQSLILENKNTESSYYLAKFARILRLSLEHSRKKYVSFAEELEAIDNYLDLQKLRFGDLFKYKIENNISEINNIEVPPMMIQPFVENSIYHGFKNIDYQGELLISFKFFDNFIECIIKDNGKGFAKEENLQNKDNTSLSTIITKERLQILTNSKNISGMIEIKNNSKSENGATVKVQLPYIKE
jgi:tetratricopeptide (TPR) repeat protein